MRSSVKLIAQLAFVALIAASAFAINASKTNTIFEQNTSLAGDVGIWKVETGRLWLTRRETLIGYFGGGQARFVGFGCSGHANPVIATGKELLVHCRQIAPIKA